MCPLQQKTRVPVLLSVPSDLDHAPPRSTMCGRLQSVSTLLTTVGCPYRPLTADVRAGTAVHDHVAGESAAQDVLADVPGRARLVHAAFQEQALVPVFAPDVDESDVHLQGIGCDEDAFDELMGALVDEVAIL